MREERPFFPLVKHTKLTNNQVPGDVLGFMIKLPPLSVSDSQELESRIWQPEQTSGLYLPFKRHKQISRMQGSEIRVFKNGKELGVAFRNLYLGRYLPCVSSYFGGKVTLNFGPEFKFKMPVGARAYSEVKNEVPGKSSSKHEDKIIVSSSSNVNEMVT